MTNLDKIASAAVDRYFRPPNAARAARRQVFIVAGTGLLVLAALDTDRPVSLLLWAWIVYRAFVFAILLVIGPRMADELTRRLNAVPPVIRQVLSGGGDR